MFCPNCAAENPDEAQFCGECGRALPRPADPETPSAPSGQPGQPAPAARPAASSPAAADSKRMAAGVLAILLGSLGIHKFLLGYHIPGVILLVLGTVGWVLVVPGMVAVVIGIIEGIIYLTKSDEEFRQIYVDNQRPWF